MMHELAPLVAATGTPMRPVDIAGLFVAMMILGLLATWFYRSLGRGMRALIRGTAREESSLGNAVEAFCQAGVLFMGSATVVMSSLYAMKLVFPPRPGPYPVGALATIGAAIGLLALIVILTLHALAWREGLASRRVRAHDDPNEREH